MPKFLVIQTAFIGDVVLATSVVEKLHGYYPGAEIDFLLRKGNEGLLAGHPYLHEVLIWDKTAQKNKNLVKLVKQVRAAQYDYVINLHRFATSGIITWLSGAKHRFGFDKNPFSFGFTKAVRHIISDAYTADPIHEIARNQSLIADITDNNGPAMPALYPSAADEAAVQSFKQGRYICIAPSSVWFTKQFPAEKWMALINALPAHYTVYLLGGKGDQAVAGAIKTGTTHPDVQSLCGRLNFLQSAALMKDAVMNYVNDSAPLHFCSAVNAPVTAVYCSTVPAFGFGPVRPNGHIAEIQEHLYCRPCGLHGHKACPEGHFKCAMNITNEQLLWWTSKAT